MTFRAMNGQISPPCRLNYLTLVSFSLFTQSDGLCVASGESEAEETEPVPVEAPVNSGSITITMTGIKGEGDEEEKLPMKA